MNAKPTERQEVTYLGRPAFTWDYRSGGEHGLRVRVRQWKDSGEMYAKVIEGSPVKRNFVEHAPDRLVTETDLENLVTEWIG